MASRAEWLRNRCREVSKSDELAHALPFRSLLVSAATIASGDPPDRDRAELSCHHP
jgi:hypothetical protein